jgi:hypothetical protein
MKLPEFGAAIMTTIAGNVVNARRIKALPQPLHAAHSALAEVI